MSVLWYQVGASSLFPTRPLFAFHGLPEIHAEAPTPYAAAMAEMKAREMLLGAGWFKHNAELAHTFWEKKKPWWLC